MSALSLVEAAERAFTPTPRTELTWALVEELLDEQEAELQAEHELEIRLLWEHVRPAFVFAIYLTLAERPR